MRTEPQIAASRANGAKSRGPLTAAGKRNANRNNIRHALVAGTVVLDSESLPKFKALLSALHAELDPQGEMECALVESLAVVRWRQMRLWAFEKSGIDNEIRSREIRSQNDNTASDAAASDDAPTRAYLAFRGITDQSRSLELINRYETRCDRQFLRLVRHFEKCRFENPKISVRTQQAVENKDAA